MLYAVLAYHEAGLIEALSPEQDAALMETLHKVHGRWPSEGKLGPAARLDATTTAVTLRGPGEGMVLDGPFAETKEHLLGLYVLDCANLDEAVAAARDLRRANPSAVYEIRPIPVYLPGASIATLAG